MQCLSIDQSLVEVLVGEERTALPSEVLRPEAEEWRHVILGLPKLRKETFPITAVYGRKIQKRHLSVINQSMNTFL
ncbi:hypothetical protein CPB84DRAFT_816103 [Gymnopilus junonius]|uniref:Uncharacterized protein n=1 Tax=Gymnopilus junonius TaxID=109634 RepID=A0A9P5TNI5_GYMJU|nr:hypothetical protein CPB84DRAFT_816103 [Gymnopilus junonius]